ncbi:MAG: hypothetical protein Q8L00_03560, partial [Deltaproteobacteria bacterium]|nr:hypothetical protein [Deltaproteobacteria bacterium]
ILIPVYFWIQHIFYRKSIAKIASYIAIFLEGNETNLMWENRVKDIDLKIKGPRITYNMRIYLLPYPILLIVSILIAIWKFKPDNELLILIIISIAITLIILLIAKKTIIPYTELRKPWIDAFKELKSQEESALTKATDQARQDGCQK